MGKKTRGQMDRDNSRNRERYANDPEFREKAKAMVRGRYANNPEFREKKLTKERERYANDPEYRERHKSYRLEKIWRKNGIHFTIEQRDAMLSAQGGRCAICGTDEPGGRGWHLDHCHVTGRVRGILCHHCNIGLGNFKDNPEFMREAIKYLEESDEAGKSEAA